MLNKDITYDHLEKVGTEIFTKLNPSFYRSKLSEIMSKIFITANLFQGNSDIREIDGEGYMKSGTIPERVYYIYSDQLKNSNPDKLYDVVYFKGQKCIWFYIENIINDINHNTVNKIHDIYDKLFDIFGVKDEGEDIFITLEIEIVKYALTIRLLYFISTTYNIISLDDCIDTIKKSSVAHSNFTAESISNFIDDIVNNAEDEEYFIKKLYLDSYMLLQLRDNKE